MNVIPMQSSLFGPDRNEDDAIIQHALDILAKRHAPGEALENPNAVKHHLRLKYGREEREVFGVIWLTTRHHILAEEVLFLGTVNGASVHPREVVKSALSHNAAAAVFFHNHPGGNPEPSSADQKITKRLIDALRLIEVCVLDHLVVSTQGTASFAERGLI